MGLRVEVLGQGLKFRASSKGFRFKGWEVPQKEFGIGFKGLR